MSHKQFSLPHCEEEESEIWRADSSACFRPHSQWVMKWSWSSVCPLHHGVDSSSLWSSACPLRHRVDSSNPWSSACPLRHGVVSSHFLWTLVFFSFLLYPVTSLIVFFFSLSLCDYRLSCFVSSSFVVLLLSPFFHVLHTTFSLYSYTPCLQCRPQVITKAMQAFPHQVLIRDSELGWWTVMR